MQRYESTFEIDLMHGVFVSRKARRGVRHLADASGLGYTKAVPWLYHDCEYVHPKYQSYNVAQATSPAIFCPDIFETLYVMPLDICPI